MGKDFEEVRQLSSNIEAWRYPEGGQLYFVGRQEVALDYWVKMTEGRLEHQLRNSFSFSDFSEMQSNCFGEVRRCLQMETFKQRLVSKGHTAVT